MHALSQLFRQGLVITRNGLLDGGHRALVAMVEGLGGFGRLRRLAGLPRQRHLDRGRALDAPAVTTEIQRRHRAGAPLASSLVPGRLRYAAERAFGSWGDAVRAAGYDYAEISLRRKYTDDDLLEIVRRLAREFPAMTYTEMYRHPIRPRLQVRFGSLREALCRAGLPDWAPRGRSRRSR